MHRTFFRGLSAAAVLTVMLAVLSTAGCKKDEPQDVTKTSAPPTQGGAHSSPTLAPKPTVNLN